MNSADIWPPPRPMTMLGLSRSGTGHAQPQNQGDRSSTRRWVSGQRTEATLAGTCGVFSRL